MNYRMNVQAKIEFAPVQGAEAWIELVDWYGRPAIRKQRVPKAYRIELLDQILRTRRTKEEVEILHHAKLAGVKCPEVFFADPSSSEIIMNFINGPLLKDIDGGRNIAYEILGKYAGMLHSKGIIHGDLTTKNVVVSGSDIFLLDFGLSFYSDRLEDRADDLHLLKQVLKSSQTLRKATANFDLALKGYASILGRKEVSSIKKQIGKIELRGRYAQVD